MSDRPEPAEQGAGAVARIDWGAVLRILPQLIDSLTDAVIVTDREHRVVAANRRYLEVFGAADRAGVAGADCEVAVRCAEAMAGMGPGSCAACDVLQTGSPQRRMRIVSDESGAARRWEATFSPVLDRVGDVSHVV